MKITLSTLNYGKIVIQKLRVQVFRIKGAADGEEGEKEARICQLPNVRFICCRHINEYRCQ